MDSRNQATRAPIVVNVSADEVTADDMPLYRDTMQRALRFLEGRDVKQVEVYVNARGVYCSQPEWLEYAILVRYHDATRQPFRIGAIQRTIGADSEFHS